MDKNRKPSKDFSSRFDHAKKFRDNVRADLWEILLFISPGRQNDFDTPRDPSDNIEDDEIFNSLYEDLTSDFASDLITYYTPAESKWTEYLVTAPVPEEVADEIEQVVTQREDDLFDMVKSSNYYDVAPQVAFEASHGTMAMWVEKSSLSQPIYCEAVPPHELFLTPGHQGLLDRFRETMRPASTLEALFSGWDVDLEDPQLQRKMKKAGQYCKICWGFWADWSDSENPVWKYEITVDGKRITAEKPDTLGPIAGSCPLLVGRFNPQIGKPWGRGPAWKALPDMRKLDAVVEAVLDGLDQAVRSTVIYRDDGVIDVDKGVIPGSAIPAGRNFTRDQVYELTRQANLEVGFLSEERIEERLRECFYQDGPRQKGDTPPTASQWLDERHRVQLRIGKPSAPLWREFFLPFIQRMEFIGVEIGKFDGPLTHNGDVIDVQPISPLQKAANQDKIVTSRSNLELLFSVAGEAAGQVVDLQATFLNHVTASGDDLTVIRKEPISEPTAPNGGAGADPDVSGSPQ